MKASRAFRFDAGSLALDFLNTGRQASNASVELIPDHTELVRWLSEAGLVSDDATPLPTPEARILLSEARRLRGAIDKLVAAHARRGALPPEALHVLNRALDVGRTSTKVERREDGGLTLVTYESSTSVLSPLFKVALSAALLLVESRPQRVRRCASEVCRLWFLDTSKNGRRRWCSMAICGNRAKVARHHRKRRNTSGGACAEKRTPRHLVRRCHRGLNRCMIAK